MNRTRKLVVLLCLIVLGLSSIYTSVYFQFSSSSNTGISAPNIILEAGTSGTSTIYSNGTSASFIVDSYSTTFYPNQDNITIGQYVLGATPSSVNQIDTDYFTVSGSGSDSSETQYYPLHYNLLNGTSYASGSINNLTIADGVDLVLSSHLWNDTLLEYVNINTSNVDSNTSIGRFTNFTAQQIGPDNITDTLVEDAYNWWNSDYLYRTNINVTTGPNTPYKGYENYTVEVTIDSTLLIALGKMRQDGNDLRIVYYNIQELFCKVVSFSGVSGTHTDFPARVLIQDDTELSARSQDGHEIYFTSDTEGLNKLAYERITYSEDAQGADLECWVKIPSLNATTNIYMWYGETTLPDQENPTEVWSNGYEAVWHLDETGSGNRLDATDNSRHAAPENYDSSDDAPGVASGSYYFDEAGTDRLVSSNFAPGTTATTLEAWVFHEESDDDRIIAKTSSGTPTDASYIYSLGVSGTTLRGRIHTGGTGSSNDATTSVPLNTWAHTAFTYDDLDDTIRFYVNGSAAGTASKSGSIDTYSNVVVIGDNDDGLNDRLWTGKIDEVRVSSVARTGSWLSSQVNNMIIPGTAGNETTQTYQNNIKRGESQVININSSYYRNSTGWWKIKIIGDKKTANSYNVNIDYISFITNYTSQFTTQTEFLFTDITDSQSPNINFTTICHNSVDGATITIQVWNYTTSSYSSSGQGYASYISSGVNNTQWLNISTNPSSCINNTDAKIRITSVYSTTQGYQQYVNYIRLLQEPIQKTHNYSLRVKNLGVDTYNIRLVSLSETGLSRLINCTIFLNSSIQVQVVNGLITSDTGAWVNITGSDNQNVIIMASSINQDTQSKFDLELESRKNATTVTAYYPISGTII